MPRSRKTQIIEALFNERWQGPGRPLSDATVSLGQVEVAIRLHNEANPTQTLSTKNPANFFKDFIRKKRSANENWPKTVLARGYTARQVTGEGQCFEFVPLEPGQKDPFPVSGIHTPGPGVPIHQLQSASMPLASRRLGRRDEAWLIQVLARLHVVETHLALHSKRPYVQVDLLQTNIKLARTEIDALFLAIEGQSGEPNVAFREVIIACEAKGLRDDVLEDQLVAQVKATFRIADIRQEVVIPMAAKAIAPSRIYMVQFAPVDRKTASGLSTLAVESEAIYELVPPVPGVGK